MTRNKRSLRALTLLTALLLALSAGCSKPDESYVLQSRQAAEADGHRYTFTLDLDEAGSTYETFIAARLNTARFAEHCLELQLSLTSPTGQTAIERIAFPLRDAGDQLHSSRHGGSVRDFLWPWRDQIRIDKAELGRWTLVITLPDATLWSAVEGIGLSYHTTTWEKAN